MEINESNFAACIARIAARGSIGQKEAFALLEEVSEAAERQRISGSEDPIVSAAWGLARDMQEAALNKKIDAVLNTKIRLERVDEATQGGTTLKGAMDKLKGSLFWLAGQDNKENVESLWRGLSNQWNSVLFAKLQREGLLEAAKDTAMFAPVAREISKLRTGMATVELPTDSPARKIAEIIFENQEAQRARLNGSGARIADAKDWIAQMSHDGELMRRGGRDQAPAVDSNEAFQRWWSFTKDKLDDKTFADIVLKDNETIDQARERFGRDVFNAIYTGIHMRQGMTEGPAYEAGGYNIARKLAQGRTLFFKDGGDAWSEYMAQYGRFDNWLRLSVTAADTNARRAALMKYWGTNPQSNMNVALRNIAERMRDTDPDGAQKFMDESNRTGFLRDSIKGVMKLLDGTADKASNQMWAEIGRTARAVSNMSFLGSVGVTHATSLFATVTSDSLMHGDSLFTSLGRTIEAQFRSLKNVGEQSEFLEQLGAYGEGITRHIQDPFGHGVVFSKDQGYGIPGAVAQVNDKFMTATGINFVLEHTKAGRKAMLANKYARALDGEWAAMKPQEQKMLGQYNIGPEEWKLLKTATLTKSEERAYLTPNAADTIDRQGIVDLLTTRGSIDGKSNAAAIDRAVNGFRQDIADRLTMLYQDSGDLSTVRPGVRQRSFLQGSSEAGSWRDELMRSVLQYHAWPVAAVHQILARQFYENSTAKFAANFGIITGLSVIGGYIRSAIRDLSSGEPPQTPRSVGEAGRLGLYWAAQGGAGGILADWMFGELNRSYKAGLESAPGIGGPIGSAAGGLIGIISHMAQSIGAEDKLGEPGSEMKAGKAVWNQMVHSIAPHIPFANLVYTKTAFDYLVLWHLYEAVKPGWWQKTNETLKKETGRTHFGFHPYQSPPYSPF